MQVSNKLLDCFLIWPAISHLSPIKSMLTAYMKVSVLCFTRGIATYLISLAEVPRLVLGVVLCMHCLWLCESQREQGAR